MERGKTVCPEKQSFEEEDPLEVKHR
jgi:hypothetical protein